MCLLKDVYYQFENSTEDKNIWNKGHEYVQIINIYFKFTN